LALSPGAWTARRRDGTAAQRSVLIGLAAYLFASSLADLYGFIDQIQESAAAPTPEQWDWMMQAHGQFAQAVDQHGGKILGGEALHLGGPAERVSERQAPAGSGGGGPRRTVVSRRSFWPRRCACR
jgi:hypothetical protein